MTTVKRQSRRTVAVCVLAAISILSGYLAVAETIDAGLIVEHVKPNFEGDRAGIQSGDILTSWSSPSDGEPSDEGARGDLATLFDLIELEREKRPVRLVTLHGLRGNTSFSVAMGPGKWWIKTKPRWHDSVDARYVDALNQLNNDAAESGIDAATHLAQELLQSGEALIAAWLLSNSAQTIGEQGQWEYASYLYDLAVEALDLSANRESQAVMHYNLGIALMKQNRFDEAHEAFTASLETHKSISPDRLGVASNLRTMGEVDVLRGRLDSATNYLEEALWFQEQQAPDSLSVARTLNTLGRVAVTRRNLSQGEQYYQRAMSISETLVPNSSEFAGHLNGLAIATYLQGDEAGAESLFERSLAIKLELEPDSVETASLLGNVGLIKKDRGDYRAAEQYYRRALALQERLYPDGIDATRTLNNLGVLSLEQGYLVQAEAYQQRVYAIRQALAPDSLDLAITLINLGNLARFREAYDAAEAHYREALDIQQMLAPTSAEAAMIWVSLGLVAQSRGDLDLAETRAQRGLSIFASIAPNGRGVAAASTKLGDIKLAQNALKAAGQHYQRASSILEKIAPLTYKEARAFYGLAKVHRSLNESDVAKTYYERALHALDGQHARLGGTEETKAMARSRNQEIYKDYVGFLLDLGEEESAFDVLERSRSKVLSDLLTERDLVFDLDIPAELEHERRLQARTYEKLQTALYETQNANRVEELHESLRDVRLRQEQIRIQIRDRSPRLDDLRHAMPTALNEVRAALRQGTVVLSYDVGDSESRLFELSPQGSVAVHTLQLGRAELENLVTRFRHLIDAGRWDEKAHESLLKLAASLYQQLIAPAERSIENADRLLIVPDAALNLLPFAALVRSYSEDGPLYLAQWKPSQVVSSLTVYGQLQKGKIRTAGTGLIAFGDPAYSDNTVAVNDAHGIQRRINDGKTLTTLPWSRSEVEDIGDIYADTARIYTGVDATEERAKAIEHDNRYIHFASHALLNERHPLDTSIVLATPNDPSSDRENGFLQAWEVYESVRLNADLVTLSACETALGTDYPGEGLIGLTRAFQYAGASSVLASLWNVNDRSTSQLMAHFYENLSQGMAQEDALRQAQIALLRGERKAPRSWLEPVRRWFSGKAPNETHSHPYHWAGFVLNGAGG